MAELRDLLKRAQEIRAKYDELNARNGQQQWTASEYAEGLVGDVGDLMKLVMAKEGKRHAEDIDAKLQHELSDCIWSLLIIASEYNIDLEQSFFATMDELERRF